MSMEIATMMKTAKRKATDLVDAKVDILKIDGLENSSC
jgi:hypothetical protein